MTSDTPDIRAQSTQLTREVLVPALAAAMETARTSGAAPEAMLNAVLNSFGELMTAMIGPQLAATALRDFADHLERTAPPAAS